MVIGSMMSGDRKKRIIADLEEQGAKARETKKGILIYAPGSNDIRVISAISGDVKGLRDDIAWFRKHGLNHPADRKEMPAVAKPALTNEEGYPMYVVGPINGTTRKRVLSELEKKGWPLRVKPTELTMDTVTATRALYNVGYRWDHSTTAKARVWVAPDDIKEMHERVKAEMDRREQEAREARIVHHEAMAGRENVEDQPVQAVKTDSVLAAVQEARTKPLPSLDFVKHVGHEGEHHPIRNPHLIENPTPKDVADAIEAGKGHEVAVPFEPEESPKLLGHVVFQEKQEDYALASFVDEKPAEPEREFIDSVDSWVIADTDLPPLMTVRDLRWTLEAAGLEVEVRVWRKR